MLFDRVAENFAREIDQAILNGSYTRGEIHLELVKSSIRPGQCVLDYGCGPGRMSLLLARAGFQVCGVDISERMIAQARAQDRQRPDLEFELIDESWEGLRPQSYDAIVCSSVIEYVADHSELLGRFHTALRGAGALIISYANESSLWRQYCMKTGPANPLSGPHHRVWSWPQFRALLSENGFRVTKGPIFFDSPLDRYRWTRILRGVPWLGSLGVVVARPDPS